jgi:hypothetical protein
MKTKLNTIFLFLSLFMLSSCLQQGETPKIPGIDGPKLNIVDGKILLSVGLENIDLPAGATLPIPKLDHSSVTVSPRFEGGSLIQVAFDLRDVESDEFKVVPSQTLPDGRPFPFLVGGELPALAFNIQKAFDSTFYASNKAFGFFVPVKFPPEVNFNVPIRLKINDKNYGIFSAIGNGPDGQGSGFILLLTLDNIRNNDEAQNLLKLSKRYKGTVF